MKLRIRFGVGAPEYKIEGSTINGIDLSMFPEGGKFVGDDSTQSAGIRDVTRINGELHVTLKQHGTAYQCKPTNGSHDWKATGEWIDAETFSNDVCYIVATSKPEGAEYVKTDGGWTVAFPEAQDELV